ncbi:unnamed protein product, partial [Prorocentrum cordatum]
SRCRARRRCSWPASRRRRARRRPRRPGRRRGRPRRQPRRKRAPAPAPARGAPAPAPAPAKPAQAPSEKRAPSSKTALEPGDRLMARYHRDGQMHPGILLMIQENDRYLISWDEPDDNEPLTSCTDVQLLKKAATPL